MLLLHFGQRKSILSPLAAPLLCGYESFLIEPKPTAIKPRSAQLVARRAPASWAGHLPHKKAGKEELPTREPAFLTFRSPERCVRFLPAKCSTEAGQSAFQC